MCMAADRSRRTLRGVNYVLYSETGKKYSGSNTSLSSRDMAESVSDRGEKEDGQIEDSPLELHAVGDQEFHNSSESGTGNQELEELDDTLLDQSPRKLDDEESMLSSKDQDLAQDEVWQQQQKILLQNQEKRDKYKLQLQRRKQLNEALLRQEQDRLDIAKMEQQVTNLERKRFVTLKHVENNKKSNMAAVTARLPGSRTGGNDVMSGDPGMNVNKHCRDFKHVEEIRVPKKDKVNMWLASNEDLNWIHETRSEPGDYSNDHEIQFNYSRSRKALNTNAGASARGKQHANRGGAVTFSAPRATQPTRFIPNKKGKPDRPVQTLYVNDDRDPHHDGECFEYESMHEGGSRLRSGFLDKPMSQVVTKMRWPHMNQNPRYVTSNLMFNQLNFCQFVGGECRTIQKTLNETELMGRLRVLSKVAYMYDQCKDWEKARGAYFAILSSIEEGEATWDSTFGHYDIMCPPRWEEPPTSSGYKPDMKSSKPKQLGGKKEFFCRDFQKNECTMQAPHKAWIRNSYEMVDHFCATCFKNKCGKLPHGANADCPGRK